VRSHGSSSSSLHRRHRPGHDAYGRRLRGYPRGRDRGSRRQAFRGRAMGRSPGAGHAPLAGLRALPPPGGRAAHAPWRGSHRGRVGSRSRCAYAGPAGHERQELALPRGRRQASADPALGRPRRGAEGFARRGLVELHRAGARALGRPLPGPSAGGAGGRADGAGLLRRGGEGPDSGQRARRGAAPGAPGRRTAGSKAIRTTSNRSSTASDSPWSSTWAAAPRISR